MINARAETVAEKPSYRSAYRRRRCLVPADGYFEWKKLDAGKQPYYIHRSDETPFAMAALWESWHSDQDDALLTFTVITTDANHATSCVHDRMPVIVDPDDYAMWLDPEFQNRDALQVLLRPYEADDLQLTPVSTHVNSPRHDDPRCIEPYGSELRGDDRIV
jgi:putative SOS response-associated peptidase YedK